MTNYDYNTYDNADYVVNLGTGDLEPTEDGKRLTEHLRRLKDREEMMDKAWVGAYIVSLFLEYPELDKFRINISREGEYDDAGGTYMSTSVSVRDVTLRDGSTTCDGEDEDEDNFAVDEDEDSETEVADDDGISYAEDDERTAHEIMDLLESELEDYSSSLAEPFFDNDNEAWDANLVCEYGKIRHLLESGQPVSGLKAFEALFESPNNEEDALAA